MRRQLNIQVLSDPNYEDLVAEAYADQDCVMVISQERGFDQLEVELVARPDGQTWRIAYDDLAELLQMAKTRLWELRRIPGGGAQAPG